MTAGVSLNSRSATATFAATSGTWDANYPVANLGDLLRISKVGRVVPVGNAFSFTFVLPAAVAMQFIGLVRHTIPGGASMQIRLYSDAGLSALVANSGSISVWGTGAPASGYPSVRPYVFSAPVVARGGRIDVTSVASSVDIGGVEIGDWWAWALGPGKEFGFDPQSTPVRLFGGAEEVIDAWAPRILNGQIDRLALAEAGTTGIDFQKVSGKGRPFVFVQEYDDPATWARTAMLATNRELPPSVGALYRHDTFQFRLGEHWR